MESWRTPEYRPARPLTVGRDGKQKRGSGRRLLVAAGAAVVRRGRHCVHRVRARGEGVRVSRYSLAFSEKG